MSTFLVTGEIHMEGGYVLLKRGIIAIRPADKECAPYISVPPIRLTDPSNCIVTMEGGRDYLVGRSVQDVLAWYRNNP